jgi:hypothetical protein
VIYRQMTATKKAPKQNRLERSTLLQQLAALPEKSFDGQFRIQFGAHAIATRPSATQAHQTNGAMTMRRSLR